MNSRIVVLISGAGKNLQAIIDACKTNDYPGDVVGVISNNSDAYGLTRAKIENINTSTLSHNAFESRELYDQSLVKIVEGYKPDVIVLAGFMRVLTPAFVEHFHGKLLNIHPSLLPKYPGLNTHQRAIDSGDTEHGVSVHFVTKELDGGPIILQAKVPVFTCDTAEDLASRVHAQEHRIFPLVIKWLCLKRIVLKDKNVLFDDHIIPISGYASE